MCITTQHAVKWANIMILLAWMLMIVAFISMDKLQKLEPKDRLADAFTGSFIIFICLWIYCMFKNWFTRLQPETRFIENELGIQIEHYYPIWTLQQMLRWVIGMSVFFLSPLIVLYMGLMIAISQNGAIVE